MEETKNKNYNDRHPELEEDEMFLTNIGFRSDDYDHIGYKTKRKGGYAYTMNGDDINYMTPVFVQRNEYEDGMKKKPANEIKK